MAMMVPASFTGPIILELAKTDLRLIDVFDYRHPQRPRRHSHPHRVTSRRMPILIYGKEKTILKPGADFVDESSPGDHEELSDTQRLELGLQKLVSRLARPGDVVCDPVTCGRIGTALGAWREALLRSSEQLITKGCWSGSGADCTGLWKTNKISPCSSIAHAWPEDKFSIRSRRPAHRRASLILSTGLPGSLLQVLFPDRSVGRHHG